MSTASILQPGCPRLLRRGNGSQAGGERHGGRRYPAYIRLQDPWNSRFLRRSAPALGVRTRSGPTGGAPGPVGALSGAISRQLLPDHRAERLLERFFRGFDMPAQGLVDQRLVAATPCRMDPGTEGLEDVIVDADRDPRLSGRRLEDPGAQLKTGNSCHAQ